MPVSDTLGNRDKAEIAFSGNYFEVTLYASAAGPDTTRLNSCLSHEFVACWGLKKQVNNT